MTSILGGSSPLIQTPASRPLLAEPVQPTQPPPPPPNSDTGGTQQGGTSNSGSTSQQQPSPPPASQPSPAPTAQPAPPAQTLSAPRDATELNVAPPTQATQSTAPTVDSRLASAMAALSVTTALADTWLDDKVSGMLGTGDAGDAEPVEVADESAPEVQKTDDEVAEVSQSEAAAVPALADSRALTVTPPVESADRVREMAVSAQARDAYDAMKALLAEAPETSDDPTLVETPAEAQDLQAA